MAKSVILNNLIAALKTNVSKFERDIDTGASTISKAISRNSELKLDIVEKIVHAYPSVSRDWLLTGEGSMFVEPEKPFKKVPLIGDAAAGAEGEGAATDRGRAGVFL